ncbi:uncharacterized protein LOC118648130 [Monomorium pharaonis]|uniref:uncharacterized protein LOC118648130 n=1 Tax=Monomorium pharaonis TaxID=307658 RepID=UPI00174672FB|nr:uncharacterized protein LOC118648130 [Monomorium pharaonis]
MTQFDIKTAFLHGELNESIYMDVPLGVETKQGKYSRSLCLQRYIDNVSVFLGLYVDDGLVLAETMEALNKVLAVLRNYFEITVGHPSSFVGIQISRDRQNHSIFIHQENYIERILEIFKMKEAKSVSVPADINSIKTLMENNSTNNIDVPYRRAIGCLTFLSQDIQTQIMPVTLTLYDQRVDIYLRSLVDLVLGITTSKMVSLSTTEAEYVAANSATKELVWLRRLIIDLEYQCDNQRPYTSIIKAL